MRTVHGLEELTSLAGTTLGPGDWWEITQDRIDRFADATDDHQWIHVDPERASGGPFGGTIAHGYLTVSLLVPMWSELLRIDGIGMGVNYGLNKVRFPAPLPVGSKIRLHARVESVRVAAAGAVDLTVAMTVEREGGDKPVAAAEVIYRYVP
ncbi:MaoC family dehydratase [Phytohabitans houttuyneae]|uniref:MaoC family dehydratase n=1 Tax=Phytohabitans houttuyneae TaxID=1076126 RepID=A0A6V8KNE7_9ACTN|nr:MaoC family dehydratase [Phytohabitans houttuyneae]GFJ83416.1 MaoC family dehydratase [Phytohabitans houttuyneae]